MDPTGPTSFRLANLAQNAYDYPMRVFQTPGQGHPSLPHLCLLVFEAVLEVVCVSLPGYIIARLGHFDADKQKFLANLNVMLFTPCLIFTKLASQLNADKLSDLAIIPAIFVVQTLVSWVVSTLVAKAFQFNRRASNFVTAMGVFGNSNSLPISLVLSLSQTIKGLHWDRIPGDNDDEVGARGILYLLIFQQLGQLVRWSWGYHVLLASKDKYPEYREQLAEEGQSRHQEDHNDQETQGLIDGLDGETEDEVDSHSVDSRTYVPGGPTPVAGTSRTSTTDSSDDDEFFPKKSSSQKTVSQANQPPLNGNRLDTGVFPRVGGNGGGPHDAEANGNWARFRLSVTNKVHSWQAQAGRSVSRRYQGLPRPLQLTLSFLATAIKKTHNFIWEFMNPPLWAMLIAVTVASIPALQRRFFEEGSFVNNSVTNAVKSSGGVAVPLILVVLGANLARNTMARDDDHDPEEEQIGTKLLIASLLSRMVLPTVIMAPILALTAKYLPVSILDDPIFIIVCFLLTGAPSALQLAQICQINAVYEKTMGRILFQSYVIWILPSTLVLVMMALEVVEWAAAS
ncbi:membrane transport protein [Hirsutella rhossiliensis]|uniref:Membrane transport protein n=1 Tax=Hirsutella rhossiliensis TaxID=111463 RepID=A0A9P8N0Z8_9HYPO|nr:membrane transport protein [Hirsutella rhossiliensis]KAH0963956.1 membrane transport protein [Hirsutella rhossiliensis]